MEEPPKLAADRMVMRLGRWLRLLGADVIMDAALGGAQLLARAREEHRVLVTRDKRLSTAPDVLFITQSDLRSQLREVLTHLDFKTRRFALTRCSRCNTLLRSVPRELLARRVPPFVYANHDRFAVCDGDGCGRIYWQSTHPERINRMFASLGL